MISLNSQILKELYFSGAQSIAEISDAIGKSVPLVTKSIRELLGRDLIQKDGLRDSTGGRRAMVYQLDERNVGLLIAIAIDRHGINIAVLNVNNELVSQTHNIDTDHLDDSAIYLQIEQQVTSLVDHFEIDNILAIGITAPGFVDSVNATNNSYPSSSPLNTLAKNIFEKFHIHTYIENDSSALAIAEKHFGSAKDSENALIINLTWGVGLGMIVENKLFRGYRGFAGEFSHIPLADESKLCSCGKRGCLEVEASIQSAIEYITDRLQEGEISILNEPYTKHKTITFDNFVAAYQHGDQLAIQAIKKIAYMLGKGIATLIHILNPEVILISGKGMVFNQTLLPHIQSAIHEFCIPRLAQLTSIKISNLEHAQLLSSACIAIQQIEDSISKEEITNY